MTHSRPCTARSASASAARWRVIGFIGLIFVAAASSAAVAHASGAEHGHGGALAINWWAWEGHAPPVGWFLVDFALFVGGLVYVAAKPMSQAFAQRHLSIKRAISEASAAQAKAVAKHAEFSAKLKQVDSEVRTLLAQNTQEAAAERQQLVANAQQYAARMQADSGSLATQEVHRAQSRLRQAVATAALTQAKQTLVKEVTEADRQRLLENAIVELESGAPLVRKSNPARAGGPGAAS